MIHEPEMTDSLAYLIEKVSRIRHIDVPENFDVVAIRNKR